ncbi:jagged-1-like [Homarus americanus]|uniref:Jagged-1-like n=1 Tax=Homarus americanus TaxID=6706 RepID=A0A8J5MTY2_HOMAM|nr:jagged-1-like [Homarus americanus]
MGEEEEEGEEEEGWDGGRGDLRNIPYLFPQEEFASSSPRYSSVLTSGGVAIWAWGEGRGGAGKEVGEDDSVESVYLGRGVNTAPVPTPTTVSVTLDGRGLCVPDRCVRKAATLSTDTVMFPASASAASGTLAQPVMSVRPRQAASTGSVLNLSSASVTLDGRVHSVIHVCSAPSSPTAVCAEGCSEKQGYCTKPGECRCEVGWWGERCNLCFPYPGCEHGTCEKPWECVCEAGWSGMLCDTPASGGAFCGTHRGWCLNGGTCIDVPGGRNFTCSCPSLFTGQRCDYLADLTSDAPAADPGGILSTGTRHNVRVISPDNSSPSGTYSLTQPTTSNISKDTDEVTDATEEVKVEEDPKDVRRRFLQKHARISFRQPKLASSEEQSSKLPYMVVERKLLPLPVVLPRVSDIIPRDQMLAHKLNKQPTPILILGDSDNTQDNSKTMRYSLQQQTETSGRNQISENRRFLRHQQGSPGFISSVGENRNGPAPPHGGPVLVKVLNSQRRPILVSAQARALPRRNPMTPATLRTHKRPRQQSQAHMKPPTTTTTTPSTTKTTTTTTTEPPTRPTTKPSTWPPTRPSIWPTTWPSSHATTPIFQEPFTFTARTSPPSSRLPSPSPGTPVALPFTSADLGPPEDFVALEGRESIIRTYYDENANGRVHIGDISRVDDAAPHDEIFDAFIELKKV